MQIIGSHEVTVSFRSRGSYRHHRQIEIKRMLVQNVLGYYSATQLIIGHVATRAPEVVDSASEEIFKRRLDGVWDTLFVP